MLDPNAYESEEEEEKRQLPLPKIPVEEESSNEESFEISPEQQFQIDY
jgi:hypothetical protein